MERLLTKYPILIKYPLLPLWPITAIWLAIEIRGVFS